MLVAEIIIRFLIGGAVVSAFAAIGEVLKPKSLAGIFGAAPSVALATLGLAFAMHSRAYVSLEARSMLAGAAALFVYCLAVGRLFRKDGHHALLEAALPSSAWFVVALGLWGWLLR